jgi:hypothetical protein
LGKKPESPVTKTEVDCQTPHYEPLEETTNSELIEPVVDMRYQQSHPILNQDLRLTDSTSVTLLTPRKATKSKTRLVSKQGRNGQNTVDVPVVVNVISQNTPLSKQMLKSIRSSVEQIFSGPYIQGITNFELNNPMKDQQPR